MLLRNKEKILFIGDSVTDCGAREESTAFLGNSYVHLLASKFYIDHPDLDITFVNKGISGNTSRNLKERWQEAVLDENPDVLGILIGINDVWRHYNGDPSNAVSLEEYMENMKYLIESSIGKVKRIIILAPFHLGDPLNDPIRQQTDEYVKALSQLVKNYDLDYINLHDIFQNYMKSFEYQQMSFKNDKIHPTLFGHYIIFNEIYDLIIKNS